MQHNNEAAMTVKDQEQANDELWTEAMNDSVQGSAGSQGKYGHLHDKMVSFRAALANGTVVEASHNTNIELVGAIRGASHNFGIILEATYQVFP